MTEDKTIKTAPSPSNDPKRDVVKKGNHLYNTLDRYLTPLVNKFSVKPAEDFARYIFDKFNGKTIFYYAVNREMCFTLIEFAKYIEMAYNSVHRSFKRNKLEINKHYFELERSNSITMDKLSLGKKGDKKIIFLTFLGVWKLLPSFRGDIPNQLYEWFGEKLYKMMKSNQLNKGEFFFTNKAGKIVHQVLGAKEKCFIDEQGYMYASKGELLIAKTLRELGISFQYNAPIHLPEELINLLVKDYPKEILLEAGWNRVPSYITSDFLLTTTPRTVIEYWGLENSDKYNAKREIKEFIYKYLKIKVISIEPHEDQNIPLLKQKLMKELQIEGK